MDAYKDASASIDCDFSFVLLVLFFGISGVRLQVTLLNVSTNDFTNNVNLAGKVFSEYGDFIRAVISSQVKNKAETDDLFQNFFLFLVSKPLPVDLHNIKSYLYKAITNDIIDATRKVERYRSLMIRYAEYLDYSINDSKPENAIEGVEEAERIFRLIEKHLPHSEAQAISLRYGKDRNIKDVARKMNVNVRTVSRYVSIGLKKARQLLTMEVGDQND